MKPLIIKKDENLDISNIKLESTAINASLFCYIKGKGLLLVNYPDAWDIYCTVYATNIIDHEFKSNDSKNLLLEMNNFYKNKGINSNFKKEQLISLLKDIFKLNKVELSEYIHNYKVIKYFKTGLNYRIYDMDFYCLIEVDDINKILDYNEMSKVFVPFDYIKDTINGKPIADNFLSMIQSKIEEHYVRGIF